MLCLMLLVCISVSLIDLSSLFVDGPLLLIAIIASLYWFHSNLYCWILSFLSMVFIIGFINGVHCAKAKGLLTREIHPAECAKRLNKIRIQ